MKCVKALLCGHGVETEKEVVGSDVHTAGDIRTVEISLRHIQLFGISS